MKGIRIIYLPLLLCILGYFLQAQPASQVLPLNPKVRYGKLDNGLSYYVQKNSKPEKRVELRLVINAGSILEDADQLGLAHFVEHMCFNGTKNFEKNDLVSYLQSVGVKFGADLNAYTSFDETVYILPIPSDNPETLEKGLQVLEDWAHQVSFDDTEIDKERGVIMEEWRTGLGASERLRQKTFPLILKNSRYKDRLPIGDTAIIKSFKYDVIKRFYKDWYRPDLMAVIAVGDINVEEIEQKIKSHFGRIPKASAPRKRESFPVPGHPETLIAVATDKEQPFTQIQVLYKHPQQKTQTAADYRRYIITDLYSEMINQRLEELTQKADPPFLNAFSGYGSFIGDKDAYVSFALVSEENTLKGLEALLIENQRALQHGFTSSELERAKKNVLNNYETSYNEREKEESGSFVDEYVNHFLIGEASPGIDWEYNFVKTQLPGIALEEINTLPKQWITKENRVVLIQAPDKQGVVLPSETQVRELLDNVEKAKPAAYVDQTLNEPLIDKLPATGKIVKTTELTPVMATEYKLSNGVTVVIKSTDFKADEILMRSYSFGGNSLIDYADYQSALNSTGVISESGLRNFSSLDIQKLLSGKTVRVNPYISTYDEGINGNTTPKDLETLLQLTHLYFTQPRKDAASFASFIAKNKGIYQNLMSNPNFYFQDQMIKVLTREHPRGGGFPKAEDLDKVNLDRVYEIYKDRFADAGNFIFFFVGNVDQATFKPMIEKYLGSLPTVQRQENFKDLGIRPPSGVVEKVFKKGTEPKSEVRIVFTGKPASFEDRDELNVLAEILSIKLIEKLREEKGGVYGAGAYANMSKYPDLSYSFNISFPCGPENVDSLVALVYDEIKKIQQNGPSQEDIDKVKEQLKRELEEDLKTNGYWVSVLRSSYYNQLPVERLVEANQYKLIEAVTRDIIKQTALKYLNFSNVVKCILMPEDGSMGGAAKPAPSGLSAETVINSHLKAIGGKENLSKIQSMTVSTGVEVMGMNIEVIQHKKWPDQYAMIQKLPMGETKIVYNKGTAIMQGPQGKQTLPENMAGAFKYQAAPFFELAYAEMGIKADLQGTEAVDGKDAYKIVYTMPDNTKREIWYDAQSYLQVKSKDEAQEFTILSYIEVNGIKLPATASSKVQGMDSKINNTYELNPTLTESLFSVE